MTRRQANQAPRQAFLFVMATVGAALLLAAPASSTPSASPVFKVDFRITAVGGKRPPNIVETRVAAKGSLSFDESPTAGLFARADRVSGLVVVEFDILTPHPRTAQIRLLVTDGRFLPATQDAQALNLDVLVVATDDDTGSAGSTPITSCTKSAKGEFRAVQNTQNLKIGYVLRIPPCGVHIAQNAFATHKNSPIQASITPRCLRTTAARKPLCGSASTATWSGTWKRTEVPGNLILTQSGSSVTGSWTWNDGTGKVTGTTKDGRLTGTFNESCCSGSFALSLSAKSFSGSYTCTRGCNGTGPFSGTCMSGACLKNP